MPWGEAASRSNESRRLKDAWYCTEHRTIHLGDLGCFSMAHRHHLHPVYVHQGPAEPLPPETLRASVG